VLSFFGFLKKGKDECEEEMKEKKQRRERRKALASAALMLMLLVSVYAEPAAAFSWPKPNWNWEGAKTIVDAISKITRGVEEGIKEGIGFAMAGATLGLVGGPFAEITSTGGAALGFAVGFAHGFYRGITSSSETKSSTNLETVNKNATNSDVKGEDYLKYLHATQDEAQAAYKELAKYTQELMSDFVAYDIDSSKTSSTGDFQASIYAPDKIHGFSAFPVQIRIKTKKSPIPFEYIHLQRVSVYVISNGSTFWTRTWEWSGNNTPLLNGEDFTLGTILKVPDPYKYTVRDAIDSGIITKELIEKLRRAAVQKFEIGVDITGQREQWETSSVSSKEDCDKLAGSKKHVYDSNNQICYIFDGMKDISLHEQTLSAYSHVPSGVDVFVIRNGTVASAPLSLATNEEVSTKWTPFQEEVYGALSNFEIVSYSTLVHVMDSTANWMFHFQAVPDYFNPIKSIIGTVNFSDEYRLTIIRILSGDKWEVADTKSGHLGTLNKIYDKSLPVTYTSTNDTINFRPIGLFYVTLKRDDGKNIPIWFLVLPKVSVQRNHYVATSDTRTTPLVKIANKSTRTQADIKEAESLVETIKQGLNEKIVTAESLKTKAEHLNDADAESYAKSAISAYKDAEEALNKYLNAVKGNNKYALNWLNVARKMEDAGDFYLNAAQNALNGDKEQAKYDATQAENIKGIAKEYKPHLNIKGILNGNLPFGLTMTDLIVLALAALAAFIGKMFLGPIGYLASILILVAWFGGRIVGFAADKMFGSIFDKLKFW